METYGNGWDKEAHDNFSHLVSCHNAITSSCHMSQVLAETYGRLNYSLVGSIRGQFLSGYMFTTVVRIDNACFMQIYYKLCLFFLRVY